MHWKMNTYCPFAKKLTDRDSPKITTYTSPTLSFYLKSSPTLFNQNKINFDQAHLWDGSHFPGASQSAGTAN